MSTVGSGTAKEDIKELIRPAIRTPIFLVSDPVKLKTELHHKKTYFLHICIKAALIQLKP